VEGATVRWLGGSFEKGKKNTGEDTLRGVALRKVIPARADRWGGEKERERGMGVGRVSPAKWKEQVT